MKTIFDPVTLPHLSLKNRLIRSATWENMAASDELLSLSRPLIREPNLPTRWKSGDIRPAACISCNACYKTPGHKCIFILHVLK